VVGADRDRGAVEAGRQVGDDPEVTVLPFLRGGVGPAVGPGRDLADALLQQAGGPRLTRSEAERKLLRLIRAADLPVPETNARVHRYRVDLLWRDAKLVVEVDGYRFHSSRAAFERDRARDATLVAVGYAVVRVTWRQLVERPEIVVARISAALATR